MRNESVTLNKANWDERAPLHAASLGYAAQTFVEQPDYLSDVVRFDRPLLGDVAGLRGVHLQCHIGTDTLSLARLGAHMTGLDFSSAAIAQAQALAQRCATPVDFVVSDVHEATQVLAPESFDLVYVSIGSLNWLPSVDRWASVVGRLLKPGGRLFVRDAHPLVFAVDETCEDAIRLTGSYFEHDAPIVTVNALSYVDMTTPIRNAVTHEWNHGLGQVVTAVLNHGMQLSGLVEHACLPWEAFPGQMHCADDGEWRLNHAPWRMPLSYTLQAIKRRS